MECPFTKNKVTCNTVKCALYDAVNEKCVLNQISTDLKEIKEILVNNKTV